jgi:hypothetical protein
MAELVNPVNPVNPVNAINAINEENNQLITVYNEKIQYYFQSITKSKYLFEITKCCNYSEIVSVYKEQSSLRDLYQNVLSQFEHNSLLELSVIKNDTDKLVIPNDENILLREFINRNSSFFIPIYPLPAAVVYRIIFDDGHVHSH